MRDDIWEHAPRIKAHIEEFEVVDEVQSVLCEVDCWRRGVLKETSRKYVEEVIWGITIYVDVTFWWVVVFIS